MSELSVLGTIEIVARPSPGNHNIMTVHISCTTRDEVVHADTRSDERLDQFSLRLRGMLQALYNAPLKKEIQEKEKEDRKKEILGSLTGVKK